METILPALAILGALMVVMDSGRGSAFTKAVRREQERARRRLVQRLRLVAHATDTSWHGTLDRHPLVLRRAPVGLLLRADLSKPLFHKRLRVKVKRGARALEERVVIKTDDNLATRALFDDPEVASTLDALTEVCEVVIGRDRVDCRLDADDDRLPDRLRALLGALERRGAHIDVPRLPARQLGFLPSPAPEPRVGRWPVHGVDGSGELVLDGRRLTLERSGRAPVSVVLDGTLRALLSRAEDRAGEPLIHLQLRQRDAGPDDWRELVLSTRAAAFDAPPDLLPALGVRGHWLQASAFVAILGRVREAMLASGGTEDWL